MMTANRYDEIRAKPAAGAIVGVIAGALPKARPRRVGAGSEVTVRARRWLCLATFLALAAKSPASAERVTIREWLPRTDGYRDFLKIAADEFKKSHPDITIVVEDFPPETYRTAATGISPATISAGPRTSRHDSPGMKRG
jgi:ABC-type glycerol-3-phosphate transport system substrate-binding protein